MLSQDRKIQSIVDQWKRERPDIDPIPMAVCAEVWRAGDVLKQGVLANLANYDLDFPGADVILTLRRQGVDTPLSPSELAKEMMLSTSAMTNRLDRLEKRNLIERASDPNDRRGLKVALTEAGQSLADEMVASHVKTEEQMLAVLSAEERDNLRVMLNKIIRPDP